MGVDDGRRSSEKPDSDVPAETAQIDEQSHLAGSLILSDKGIALPLQADKPEIILGRTDLVQNIFPDVDFAELEGEGNGVSRRHARILRNSEGIYLEDLNSTNFTFLNNQRLDPGRLYPLKNGDEIRLGLLTLEYRR